jgi:nicotine blue oxidoreductase
VKVEGIVLAAGLGTRLGQVKPLLLVDGIPTLARVIATLREASIERIVVVLGSAAEEIRRGVDLSSCRVVVNPDYAFGLSGSLRAGIACLAPDTEGTLVVHADLPWLSPATIRAVLARAEAGATLARATHRGLPGFPVFLHRSTLAGLLPTLSGDHGAREYLAQHRADVVQVEVDDPGAVLDVDRPEDVAELALGRRRAR